MPRLKWASLEGRREASSLEAAPLLAMQLQFLGCILDPKKGHS